MLEDEVGVDGSEDGVDGSEVFGDGDGHLATLREGVGGKANELGLGRFRSLTLFETNDDATGEGVDKSALDVGVAHVLSLIHI